MALVDLLPGGLELLVRALLAALGVRQASATLEVVSSLASSKADLGAAGFLAHPSEPGFRHHRGPSEATLPRSTRLL